MQNHYNMLVVDLRDFGGGKIFNDQFNLMLASDIYNDEKEILIKYRGNELGIVEVVGAFCNQTFYTKQNIAFMCCNQKIKLPNRDVLLVVKYKDRNLATHAELMELWWEDVKTKQQILQP